LIAQARAQGTAIDLPPLRRQPDHGDRAPEKQNILTRERFKALPKHCELKCRRRPGLCSQTRHIQ
jgi:hypothetical protein